jgi:hypothetical protein
MSTSSKIGITIIFQFLAQVECDLRFFLS